MTDTQPDDRAPAWWTRLDDLRLTVPLAALGWMCLMAGCWKQEPEVATAAAVMLAGWSLAILRRATEVTTAKSLIAMAVVAAVAGVALALVRLPRGLLWPGVGLSLLAGFELVVSSGSVRNWAFRVSVALVGFAGLVLLWIAPLQWSVATRLVVMGLLAYSMVQLVQTPNPAHALEVPLGALRGMIFAAAVIAPSAWYAPGGLPAELARKENALFAAVCIMAALLAHNKRHGREPSASPFSKAGFGLLALILLASLILTLSVHHHAQRPVFLGVGAAALALVGGLSIRSRCPIAAKILGETALLVPWVLLPVVPGLVAA